MSSLTPEILEAISNNPNFKDKELLTELTELLSTRPQAAYFLDLYGNYCEVMDDLVDEHVTPVLVDKAGRLKMEMDQCPYWQAWKHCLFLVERLIHNDYFDSVKWESSEEKWKRRDAKCLSHSAYHMLFAVLIIEFGYDKMAEYSWRFRDHAHRKHINDPF